MKNRPGMLLTALVFCIVLTGCKSTDRHSTDRLRRRVAEFFAALRNCDYPSAHKYCSHNFQCAMDEHLFEYYIKKMPIVEFGAADIIPHLKVREVRVPVRRPGGAGYILKTYWKFERGDWFLDIVEWR